MDFIPGNKAKNLKFAASKLKAMHVTHNNQFLLDPIRKPPMTERGDLMNAGNGLMKSGSTSVLLNQGKSIIPPKVSVVSNKGLIMKMIKNFDID